VGRGEKDALFLTVETLRSLKQSSTDGWKKRKISVRKDSCFLFSRASFFNEFYTLLGTDPKSPRRWKHEK
jgi:hypothetical protein